MKESDCLPCPLCGGHAKIKSMKQYKQLIQDWHDVEDSLFQPCSVSCADCGLKITRSASNGRNGGVNGAVAKARQSAVEAWNKRIGKEAEE